jgi:hypothetical protein
MGTCNTQKEEEEEGGMNEWANLKYEMLKSSSKFLITYIKYVTKV